VDVAASRRGPASARARDAVPPAAPAPGPRSVHVVVPGDIDDVAVPSGGNAYDRRVCRGLATTGWAVHELAVAGSWPRPDTAARASLARALAGLPDGAVVLLDGLVACGVPEVVVAAGRRLRTVVLVHLPLGDESGLAPDDAAELAALERETLHGAAAVVATSPWAARRLVAQHGLVAERVHVATPGVDPAPAARGTDGATRLLCVGSLTPTKGQDLLVEALAAVPDSVAIGTAAFGTAGNGTAGNDSAGNDSAGNDSAGNDSAGNDSAGNDSAGNDSAGNGTAAIATGAGGTGAGGTGAGDGSGRPWGCDLVGPLHRDPGYAAAVARAVQRHGLGDRVRLTGPRTGAQLDAAYAAADLLVLPSRVESYGMVVTEALARGIPVLAAGVGGVPDTLGHDPAGRVPGIVVPPAGDTAVVAALAAALGRWFGEPALREGLRRAARARCRTLDGWEVTTRCLAGVLERLRGTPG
jgi:glycosyltransferase involved in cell wall biosynthesis